MSKSLDFGVYPKKPPPLSPEQVVAREQFMMLWQREIPKYGVLDRFNQGFTASLPISPGCKTLEIGAGLGEHLRYENLEIQDYYCLEYREEFCKEIRKIYPAEKVYCGDIEKKQPWPDASFDRLIAIHILEHLRNLPAALVEIKRLLKPDGVLDIVIPCEGTLAYSVARKISAERLFRNHFKMDYTPIVRNEHVSQYHELRMWILKFFRVEKSVMFPFRIPVAAINLVEGLRLRPKLDC
ncbi:MAG: class I SAM-dependent methyltransferase [Bdellovibrionia bacterium]